MHTNSPIAEKPEYIILDHYTNIEQTDEAHQSEAQLEAEMIADLIKQGYEYRQDLNSHQKLMNNIKVQLEALNQTTFNPAEWQRFIDDYLNKSSDNLIAKTRKIHDDYIFDFVFDDGSIQNIYLFDKQNFYRNKLQIINQFSQTGTFENRYDVTILINGLPLVQIELKKRGVAICEAFNQVHRYTKESFNDEFSLFQYLQIFIISNGTDTRYFANTTKREKNSFDFTMNWAKSDNSLIKDIKDFTATFLQKNCLLKVLFDYSVFDTNNTLLIMRPYQIAATERIIWKIKSSYHNKNWGTTHSGGFIWHTTGSGKTLTSFKAARLATHLEFIDKVFFVVDRKDLDYQTMKEYQKFSPDSVNGSNSTAGLKANIEKQDNKIIVTTIQKLNNLMKSEKNLAIYQKHVVFIFDEAHRSQFGEAQKNLTKKFKSFYQFGFTGTPIFETNALEAKTTASVFGALLHSYLITDAIRDEKVLKFKIDYNNVQAKFKKLESEQDEQTLSSKEFQNALLHPKRIEQITSYVLTHFNQKTHRLNGNKGFNAMFAVSSIDAAKKYYDEFKKQQEAISEQKRLKVATIFSFVDNESQEAKGEIADESFEPSGLNQTAKEFLTSAINDYNQHFKTNYSVENNQFQNYYRDLALRVKEQEVDLLIVVGMFLTGFDAPGLNTLFVDKNLRYHGLIQAYSRTNRIYGSIKSFGNIVTFRDLEQPTIDALKLFCQKDENIIAIEQNYNAYMQGFNHDQTNEYQRGFINIINELQRKFANPTDIILESDKKEFVKLFSEYLKIDNILQNFDEYVGLKNIQHIDLNDDVAVNDFKMKYGVNDEQVKNMQQIKLPSERQIQDYRSCYNDIREWIRKEKSHKNGLELNLEWDDVVFEIDLLKSQEVNLDYILTLIFEQNQQNNNKDDLIAEVRRIIKSSFDNRHKESLLIEFIKQTNLDAFKDANSVAEAFYEYAQKMQQQEAIEIIKDEQLDEEKAKRYFMKSLKQGFASENGSELSNALPKMSPLNPKYITKKTIVLEKINLFIKKFKGVGGKIE